MLNRAFIDAICGYLGIKTSIRFSWEYAPASGKTESLVDFCAQVGASTYISGPSAKSYLNETLFREQGIRIEWVDYAGYRPYPQLWGEFVHNVSIVDLLFNCGAESARYLKHAPR